VDHVVYRVDNTLHTRRMRPACHFPGPTLAAGGCRLGGDRIFGTNGRVPIIVPPIAPFHSLNEAKKPPHIVSTTTTEHVGPAGTYRTGSGFRGWAAIVFVMTAMLLICLVADATRAARRPECSTQPENQNGSLGVLTAPDQIQ